MHQMMCIVAGQRSGTTALHTVLAETGKFSTFREIFHTDLSESAGTFLNFARLRNLRVADMATEAQARKIAAAYLSYLHDIAGDQIPLLDIKLNSWHAFKPFWSYAHQMPFFMKILL